MSSKSKKVLRSFVPRIRQLDALEFDQEIHNVLFAQFMEISNYLKPGALSGIKPEINLVLNGLIFYLSLFTKNATFGQELLGLKYETLLSKNQSFTYAFLNYLVPYIKYKCDSFSNRAQNLAVRKSCDKIDVLIKIFNTINTLLFLREGKYPTVVDRLLALKYSSISKISPAGSYNYMTRELLWHGFIEFLTYILPLINYQSIKNKMIKPFFSKSSVARSQKLVTYDHETKCVICEELPSLPCKISRYCAHVACYYCLKSNVLADQKYVCPVCGETSENGIIILTNEFV